MSDFWRWPLPEGYRVATWADVASGVRMRLVRTAELSAGAENAPEIEVDVTYVAGSSPVYFRYVSGAQPEKSMLCSRPVGDFSGSHTLDGYIILMPSYEPFWADLVDLYRIERKDVVGFVEMVRFYLHSGAGFGFEPYLTALQYKHPTALSALVRFIEDWHRHHDFRYLVREQDDRLRFNTIVDGCWTIVWLDKWRVEPARPFDIWLVSEGHERRELRKNHNASLPLIDHHDSRVGVVVDLLSIVR